MGTAGAWEAIGFFVLRAPMLPFEELESWAGAAAAEADGRWRSLATRADVREALFLASPTLEAQLEPWLATSEPCACPERVRRPLAAYLTRMASRSTPFGLFAGCGAGHVEATTALVVSDDIRRRTRPDMDYLVALASRAEGEPDIRAALTWRPNSSLYQAAGRLRLVETRIDGSVRSHHLVALDPDKPLGRPSIGRPRAPASKNWPSPSPVVRSPSRRRRPTSTT